MSTRFFVFADVDLPNWDLSINPIVSSNIEENSRLEFPINLKYRNSLNFTELNWDLHSTNLYVGIWRARYNSSYEEWSGFSLVGVINQFSRSFLDRQNVWDNSAIPVPSIKISKLNGNLILIGENIRPDYVYLIENKTEWNYLPWQIVNNSQWITDSQIYIEIPKKFPCEFFRIKSVYSQTRFSYFVVSFRLKSRQTDPFYNKGNLFFPKGPFDDGLSLADLPNIEVSKPVWLIPVNYD